MRTRTTRLAAGLVAVGALVVGLSGLTSPTQAAPSIKNAPATQLEAQAGSSTLRARPFGGTIEAGVPEYYTVKVPRSGNYHVSMTGFINYSTSPASAACFVVDLQRILANDVNGYYLVSFSDSDTIFDYGLNEAIDVDLNKRRKILLACQSDVDIDVVKPISITFKRNGAFDNLNSNPYTPPARSKGGLLGNLG